MPYWALIGQNARRAAQNEVHVGPLVSPKIPACRIFPPLFHVSFYALLGYIGQNARRARSKKEDILEPVRAPKSDRPRKNSRPHVPRLSFTLF
jgi:hypothetical protein